MSEYKSIINLGVNTILVGLLSVFAFAPIESLKAQESDGNVTIEEIAEEENNNLGEEVTVRGEVTPIEPGVSFLIEDEELFDTDQVLVINVSEKVVTENADDLKLQVTGELGTLVIADLERDYGLDLDPELYVEYENEPVIFANYMVASPEIEEVSENPDSYYGQEIALEGEIGEIRNDYAFTLKEDQFIGGDNLLIINATGEPIPQPDETVVITGQVRPFVKAEFEQDYDLTWDLDVQEEIEAEYTDKPVLVVDSIYPSAQEDVVE